jgi:hypothetical protein
MLRPARLMFVIASLTASHLAFAAAPECQHQVDELQKAMHLDALLKLSADAAKEWGEKLLPEDVNAAFKKTAADREALEKSIEADQPRRRELEQEFDKLHAAYRKNMPDAEFKAMVARQNQLATENGKLQYKEIELSLMTPKSAAGELLWKYGKDNPAMMNSLERKANAQVHKAAIPGGMPEISLDANNHGNNVVLTEWLHAAHGGSIIRSLKLNIEYPVLTAGKPDIFVDVDRTDGTGWHMALRDYLALQAPACASIAPDDSDGKTTAVENEIRSEHPIYSLYLADRQSGSRPHKTSGAAR